MADGANATTFMLPSDREIVVSRFVDAPRDLVWKAWMELCDVERLAVVEPERIVQTFEIEGALNCKVVVEIVTFEDHGQRTKVTAASRFDSKEDRDSMRQEKPGGDMVERMLRFSSIAEYAE